MPATTSFDEGAIGHWAIEGAAVERMANGVDEGVVSTTLLAHELEQFIGQHAVYIGSDAERERAIFTNAEEVASGTGDGGEIEVGVMIEAAPIGGASRRGPT